jgi:hypothetical protein
LRISLRPAATGCACAADIDSINGHMDAAAAMPCNNERRVLSIAFIIFSYRSLGGRN